MATRNKSNRRPEYEAETSGGYVDGRYQSPAYTERGKRVQKLFEKTSKHDLYQLAFSFALRLSEDDHEAALSLMEEEKSILKMNGII